MSNIEIQYWTFDFKRIKKMNTISIGYSENGFTVSAFHDSKLVLSITGLPTIRDCFTAIGSHFDSNSMRGAFKFLEVIR